MTALPDLRQFVRDEAPPRDAAVVIRGGPDTIEKLRLHAERVRRAFVLDHAEVLGISVYCVLDDLGPASLDTILSQKLGTYHSVHITSVASVTELGLVLLPTFERPHHTLVLPDTAAIAALLVALGPEQPNPRYRQGQRRTGRRPR